MNLKPCPFCGGEAREELTHGQFEGYGQKTIYCQQCSATSSNAEDWNTRSEPTWIPIKEGLPIAGKEEKK